ncbi:hypothetical protein [Sphingomonas sp. 2378]|uniref:hypothetical protein n=1 Tax=Sphingomonas sp. 2378 TaxID=1219748 RepID=UPI00311AF8D1
MTAEVAIINKTAIALAADSAITLSLGSDQQKVFDSEDKLFELTRNDPIAVMINSNMHFMEAPLPVLIKRYRSKAPRFDNVAEAATHFLSYLQQFGAASPRETVVRSLYALLEPAFTLVKTRTNDKFYSRVSEAPPEGTADLATYFRQVRLSVLSEQIATVTRALESLEETEVIGDALGDEKDVDEVVSRLVLEHLPDAEGDQLREARELASVILSRRVRWTPHTGVIIAGYGRNEIFPTLISYEMYGMIDGQLRVYKSNDVDVRRGGIKAKVIPFAQKEMVERFLYGLDDEIERKIEDFCKRSIPSIREETLNYLVMEDADRDQTAADMIDMEQAFLDALREQTFDVIRKQSEEEIEGMVEFMPKPEMARMAEALVNLTSIKRRVTRGMETVGGPIDCAVISQADGFVWVKRKHYFPQELNRRYFDRMRDQISQAEEA